jgi:alkylation response protein AidB-like acyl-CoA dehydrogenase
LNYAKAREQFGKAIYHLPVISDMLITMKVTIAANRRLFYHTTEWLDKKEAYEKLVDKLKAGKKPSAEANEKFKEASRLTTFLTPLCKYLLSEAANKIAYDSMQIHGGTGYMKEFSVERLARDARITNIYEGTSQLQIVAAAGSVVNDILAEYFNKWGAFQYSGSLEQFAANLKEMREIFDDCLKYVKERKDTNIQDVLAKNLVEMYGAIYIGYLLLLEANEHQDTVFTARRYILNALAQAHQHKEYIKNEVCADILHAERILN